MANKGNIIIFVYNSNDAKSFDKIKDIYINCYKMWKWNFPKALADRTNKNLKELKKAKLEEQMKQLQKELSDLNDEDGE